MQVLWGRLRGGINWESKGERIIQSRTVGTAKGRDQKTLDLVSLFHVSWEVLLIEFCLLVLYLVYLLSFTKYRISDSNLKSLSRGLGFRKMRHWVMSRVF